MSVKRIALAYSGGLDTSVAIRWLQETYGAEIVAVALDVGEERNYEAIRSKAITVGAVESVVIDAKERFVTEFVWPALKAGAVYNDKYYMATSLGRPLIAEEMVKVTRQYGCDAVAHGCTGKGNDQVRFEVTFAALDPELVCLAPAREWGMTREQEIAYAQQHQIPIPVDLDNPYSTDVNLWGRSCECGILEDPNNSPPEGAYAWTTNPEQAPNEPERVSIGFEQGVPVSLNGSALGPVELVAALNEIAGRHGVGRVDCIEDRLVGIKSREIYECPAGAVLYAAHTDLEHLCLDKDTLELKRSIAQRYAQLVYNGLWHGSLRPHLDAFVDSTQRTVTGEVRVRLYKGSAVVEGRTSPYPLYSYEMATYDEADKFDHTAAKGFITIWGLPTKIIRAMHREKGLAD
ncbi:MAG: argininosuccinate synthase [Fimbriimonadaceae bacterium]|nr:argininosuccinate synthase [Fimbriimonadaceae bacterium]